MIPPSPAITLPSSTTPATAPASAASTASAVGPPGTDSVKSCMTTTVPAVAGNVQSISGDIDGDLVDDTATLYSVNGEWHVNATSSVTGKSSDATIDIDVDDTMTISFEDIDHSDAAATKPPPSAMALGGGPNDEGIIGNFTFLTFDADFCIGPVGVLEQPRRGRAVPVGGTARARSRHRHELRGRHAIPSLLARRQRAERRWLLESRHPPPHPRLTRAEIEFLPEQTVADSPEIVKRYGNINGCDHPLLVPAEAGS